MTEKDGTYYMTIEEYLKDPVAILDFTKKGPVHVIDEDGKIRLSVSNGDYGKKEQDEEI